MKRKSRQIVGVQLPCGAKAQSLNIIIRIASPNIAEQVLTFYGWYNQISSMKASGGCEMHLHHLIYVCFRSTRGQTKYFTFVKLQVRHTDYSLWIFQQSTLVKYRSRAFKSRGSYGNSALFLQRSQYILTKLRFLCTKEDSKWQVQLLTRSSIFFKWP